MFSKFKGRRLDDVRNLHGGDILASLQKDK